LYFIRLFRIEMHNLIGLFYYKILINLMKKIIFLLLLVTLFASCNDDDDRASESYPISQLPPATQTGANTFGCLLDGEVFKPVLQNNSYQCFYQFADGAYYFYINANKKSENILTGISIGTEKLQISQGQIFSFNERTDGKAFGLLSNLNDNTGIYQNNYTSVQHSSELKITKLDFTKNIVSGTFWFDVKDDKGVVHQIREGRFDMQFTQ